MEFNHQDYIIEREYKGNKHNKVYLVRYKETGKQYVVKVIKVRNLKQQRNEIDIQKSLDSHYAVELIQYWRKENYFILLLEYVERGDLYSLLPHIKTDFYQRAVGIFYKVLIGLRYIHAKGIVHRDIKPENILIDENFSPKIADFGISRKQDEDDGMFGGTIEYMAPEVIFKKHHDQKVDVWACGILLYEIFHRRTPFKHKSWDETSRMIQKKEIDFKPGICPLVVDFIYKTLALEPARRPSIDSLLHHPLFHDYGDINSNIKRTEHVLFDSSIPSNRTIECKFLIINPKQAYEEGSPQEAKRLQVNLFPKKKTRISKNIKKDSHHSDLRKPSQNHRLNKAACRNFASLKINYQKYFKRKRKRAQNVPVQNLNWVGKAQGSLETAIVWELSS